jgi:GT2 family glycosyltransferase
MIKIAILITSYNRVEITLNCLDSLYRSNTKNIYFDVYLVDGGSNDSTASQVIRKFPKTRVSVIDGLFWNEGMLAAWKNALRSEIDYDAFLWLNDDVHLFEDSLQQMYLCMEKADRRAIVVGYTTSPTLDEITYSALKRKGRSAINFEHTISNKERIVSMNGNCVLVPDSTVKKIGLLSSKFRHSFGDIDYGLRATKQGIEIISTEDPVALLERNRMIYSQNKKIAILDLISIMKDPKGIPLKEWLYFTRKHAGLLWPANLKLFW